MGVWRGVVMLAVAPFLASPVGTGACEGVRPGGSLTFGGFRCSLNFIFRAPDGERFAGTAGHCALGTGMTSKAEVVWPAGQGPAVADGDGRRIGEFAYAVFQRPRDFALIRLDPGVAANPEMCHFGGPTGVNERLSPEPVVLRYWGNGIGARTVSPGRSALAPGLPDPDWAIATGVAVAGDSGAGVTDADGRAVGVLVTSGPQSYELTGSAIGAGNVGITRLGPQVRGAQARLGVTLTLETAGVRTGAAIPDPAPGPARGG